MLFDWLLREGWIVFSWWLLITLAGAAIFPLCVRLLRGLPDKGYTLARAAGLLMTGLVFWLLASLGFLRNTPGSIAFSWFIVLVISLVVYNRVGGPMDWRGWWRENKHVVITAEVLFAVLLLGWAIVRAHQNSLTGTEKPMDLAFMSSAQRSDTFPPNDPWLSGYAISYYYFGYVISAMLSKMSGIASTVGFNMNISMLFALTGLTTFGVVYNLVRSRAYRPQADAEPVLDAKYAGNQNVALLIGLLGVSFVVLLGNLQTVFVEIPYRSMLVSEDYLRFWDTKERDSYQGRTNPVDILDKASWWWWFGASRTITERELDGRRSNEVIDEFPQFSFLLADNHPHVMALPYAVLAIGLAFNLLFTWRKPTRLEILFYGVCIGALVFLNTWDCPIYIALLLGADGLRRVMRNGSGRLTSVDIFELLRLAITLVAITVVVYLPFIASFRSQLAGVLPHLLYPTRFQQYFLMFGTFILILIPLLIIEIWRGTQRSRMNWRLGLQVSGMILGMLVIAQITLVLVGWFLAPEVRTVALGFVDDNGGWGAVLPALAGRWLTYGLLMIGFTLAGITIVVARLFARVPDIDELSDDNRLVITYPAGTGFALLLVAAGLMLTFIPEFVYLRDNFGDRMNTIFKFYYQSWVMFGIASAYGVYTLLTDERFALPRPAIRYLLSALFIVAILAGMMYPLLGIYSRMFVETGRASTSEAALTLDGGTTLVGLDDYEAIMCLSDLVQGDDVVVAEAVGPQYHAEFGRVGSLTGIPIIVGWEGHEHQWRGQSYGQTVGSRPRDMIELFTDLRWDIARPIIEKYGIDYIFYGATERFGQYNDIIYTPAGEQKFVENLEIVCERGGSRFYRVSPVETAQG